MQPQIRASWANFGRVWSGAMAVRVVEKSSDPYELGEDTVRALMARSRWWMRTRHEVVREITDVGKGKG